MRFFTNLRRVSVKANAQSLQGPTRKDILERKAGNSNKIFEEKPKVQPEIVNPSVSKEEMEELMKRIDQNPSSVY